MTSQMTKLENTLKNKGHYGNIYAFVLHQKSVFYIDIRMVCPLGFPLSRLTNLPAYVQLIPPMICLSLEAKTCA